MAPDPGETSSKPAWLQDNEVSVDIAQLKDFADQIQAERDKNFMVSFQKGIVPLMSESGLFGAGGLSEGRFFRAAHKQSIDAMSQMMQDVMKGMGNLSLAARGISMEYLSGDAFAQATIDDVNGVFTEVPPPVDPNAGSDSQPNLSAWQSSPYYSEYGSYGNYSGSSGPSGSSIGDGKVIAPGEAGEFVIPEDNELRGPSQGSGSSGPQPNPSPGPSPTPSH